MVGGSRALLSSLKVSKVHSYVSAVFLGGILSVALAIFRYGSPAPLEVTLFAVLLVVADSTQVEVPIGPFGLAAGLRRRPPVLSGGFLILLVAMLSLSPSTTGLVAALSTGLALDDRGPLRRAFNLGQTSLYSVLGGVLFAELTRASAPRIASLGLAILVAIVAVATNTGLVAGAVALENGWRIGKAVRPLLWPTPFTVALAFPAFLVSLIFVAAEAIGSIAVCLIIAPLIVLRRARVAKLELDEARDRTLQAFVRTVELKDPYTRRHSERVAALVVEIHRELGSREVEIQKRYFGALLHDIGKVGVPSAILGKASALSPAEYELVKRHPGLGADAVREIPFLAAVESEIRSHHERLDGRGYPDGLVGVDIPRAARVLAVADTFEALTSERPYRAAMTEQAALDEMRRVSGSQLDGEIVEALAATLDRGLKLPDYTHVPNVPRHLRAGESAALA